MINRKIGVWLPLLFSITMIVGMFLGYTMRDAMPNRSFFYVEKHKTVQEIMDLVKNKYVDEVNMDTVADTAIQAILGKLDPHSVYIPADQLQAINEDLAGKFFGIGVEFNIIDDTINIISVIQDGPAGKAGLKAGDQLLKVDDSTVVGVRINGDRIRKLLRGSRGEKVSMLYKRGTESRNVVITRDAIPLSSLDAQYMMGDGIGYIRLNKFSSQTYREFMEALESLKKQGLQKLILDLRDNGGGVLEEAVEIADELLAGDKLITYTEGKHAPKKEYRCRREGQFEKGSLVVLEDEGSASASEILMGALQDWDRATIIGRRSFGKGLVQEQFELGDNSALRLTIARYYTPIGRSIQRPYANGEKAYYDEISNRYHDGEMLTADSVKYDSNKIYHTKGGKKVYGGGGISPDYFIAMDTSLSFWSGAKINARGTISNFAYKFYLDNQARFSSFKNPSEFIKNFSFGEEEWNLFLRRVAGDSIRLPAFSQKEKEQLVTVIKAYIARLIWRTEGFYEIINTEDDAIKKAMEILKQ